MHQAEVPPPSSYTMLVLASVVDEVANAEFGLEFGELFWGKRLRHVDEMECRIVEEGRRHRSLM